MSPPEQPRPKNWSARFFFTGVAFQVVSVAVMYLVLFIGMLANGLKGAEQVAPVLGAFSVTASWIPLTVYLVGLTFGMCRVVRFEGAPRHLGLLFSSLNLLAAFGTAALIAKWLRENGYWQ